jgi:hypothetical protein
MAVIAYPYFPKRLENSYPPLVQDLIELKHSGHHECILQMVRMVLDLKTHGTDSRFFKGLGVHWLNLNLVLEVMIRCANLFISGLK